MAMNRSYRQSSETTAASSTSEFSIWVAAVFNLLASGGFALILLGQNQETGTAYISNLNLELLVQYSIALASILFTSFLYLRGSGRGGFILLFIGIIPFVSILWSPDYYQAFRQVLVFAASVFTAIGTALYFTPRALLQVVTRASLLSVLGSLVVIVVLPKFGIHSATDINWSVHAGAWKGIFIHKNHFGEAMGVALLLFMSVPKLWILSGAVRYLLIFMVVVLLAFSRSASAISFTSFTLLIVWIMSYRFTSSAMITILLRLLLVPILMVAGLWIVVWYDSLGVDSVLKELFDRDLTLTGRVPFWGYILSMLDNPLWFGLGYNSASELNFWPTVLQRFGTAFSDPHNGYIDTYISLGVVGLSFFLFITFWALFNAFRLLASENPDLNRLAQCTIVLVIFYLLTSLTESVLSHGQDPVFVNCFTIVSAMIVNDKRGRKRLTSHARGIAFMNEKRKQKLIDLRVREAGVGSEIDA